MPPYQPPMMNLWVVIYCPGTTLTIPITQVNSQIALLTTISFSGYFCGAESENDLHFCPFHQISAQRGVKIPNFGKIGQKSTFWIVIYRRWVQDREKWTAKSDSAAKKTWGMMYWFFSGSFFLRNWIWRNFSWFFPQKSHTFLGTSTFLTITSFKIVSRSSARAF